jgi:hypothetical protein
MSSLTTTALLPLTTQSRMHVYLDTALGPRTDAFRFFRPWPIERILAERTRWSTRPRYLCLRTASSAAAADSAAPAAAPHADRAVGTKFICTSDPPAAAAGDDSPKPPQQQRRRRRGKRSRAEPSPTVMFLEFPPVRNFSVGDVRRECTQRARGCKKRVRLMLDAADRYGLNFGIAGDLVAEHDDIATLFDGSNVNDNDDDDDGARTE